MPNYYHIWRAAHSRGTHRDYLCWLAEAWADFKAECRAINAPALYQNKTRYESFELWLKGQFGWQR